MALASVVALNPEVLILDEPFSGLDRKGHEELLNFLTDLKSSGKTILIATHSPEIREKVADEIFCLPEKE